MKIKLFYLLVAAIFYSAPAASPDSLTPLQPPTSSSSDSTDQAKKKTPSINVPAVGPASQQNKIGSSDKKNIIEEEDLLIEEGEVKKNAAKEAAVKDSLARQQIAAPVKVDSAQAQTPDTQKTVLPSEKVENPAANKDSLNAAAQAEKKPIEPARVESVHSINFAKNLKDYRSPKIAMFLSLLVPGLGQVYTKHYVKTGIFVALEATAIGLSVAYNGKGKKQYTDGKTFADRNFDFNKFTAYYKDLYDYIKGTGGGDTIANEKLNGIYFDTLHAISGAFKEKSAEYYRDLEGKSNPYVQGWNDCEPSLPEINDAGASGGVIKGKFFHYKAHSDPTDTNLLYLVDRYDTASNKLQEEGLFGYSPNQVTYSNMMSKSNEYYKLANTILTVMIINHLVSAVDALIGAMSYNNDLLGRESFWQHIKIDQQWVDGGLNPCPGLALRVRF